MTHVETCAPLLSDELSRSEIQNGISEGYGTVANGDVSNLAVSKDSHGAAGVEPAANAEVDPREATYVRSVIWCCACFLLLLFPFMLISLTVLPDALIKH